MASTPFPLGTSGAKAPSDLMLVRRGESRHLQTTFVTTENRRCRAEARRYIQVL